MTIKSKQRSLKEARDEAEFYGTAESWMNYAERLEGELEYEASHAAMLEDSEEDERTEQTAAAHEKGAGLLAEVRHRTHGPVEIVVTPDGKPYVLEVRGQASATAHGKQGMGPNRLDLLHTLNLNDIPVLLLFVDGGVVQAGWLGELPPSEAIKNDAVREAKRRGWKVNDLRWNRDNPFPGLPEEPDPEAPAQQGLDSMRLG